MKWFKHFSDSLDDPFIQELMDEFGHQGYVAYFGILEIVAKENGKFLTGKLTISPAYLKRKLRISPKKLRQIFEFCSEEVEEKLEKTSTKVQKNFNKTSTKPKLFFKFSKEKWFFNIPKLLDLKDNYAKDLQVDCKQPSNHKEVEVEEEEDKDKEINKERKKRPILKDEDFQKILDSPEILNELSEKCDLAFDATKWAVQRIKDYCANKQKWKTRDIPATIRCWNLKEQYHEKNKQKSDGYFKGISSENNDNYFEELKNECVDV